MPDTWNFPFHANRNWNEQRGKLKAKFLSLTHADSQYEEGKKDEILVKVQIKVRKPEEELPAIIKTKIKGQLHNNINCLKEANSFQYDF